MPVDAFYAFGSNLLGAGKFLERSEASPYSQNMAGINLTVPHKILALDCVDEIDAEARKLGAVNTVAMEKGKLRGFNTDGYGFLKAIKEEFNLSLRGKRVLVLGAGGAGRGIAVKCAPVFAGGS